VQQATGPGAVTANGHANGAAEAEEEGFGGQQEAEEAGEDVALAHLRRAAALLEQYYHPSNHGR